VQKGIWQRYAAGLITSLLLVPSVCSASVTTFEDYLRDSFRHPIVNFSLGAAFNSDAGESKNIPAHGGVFSYYNYTAHNVDQSQPLFGAFLGAEFSINPEWSAQGGFGYYEPSAFHVKGVVTQGVNVASQNQYSYYYHIQTRQFLAEGKVLYNWLRYHPYLAAGIGAALNESENYNVNIQPPFTTFSNQFGDNSTTSFTYSVGFGVDVDITEQARLGIGYRFAGLGKACTGNGMIDTVATSNTLSQDHLYSNEILAQFTFVLM
jgi:opacity protein-like surface antigen